jgi:glucose-1-phosphate adenylyltransferase
MPDVMAMVLSGGGGERLGVLSAERAVSAVPFGGKYRIIDFVLSNCCHSGIVAVGVLTQHAPTSLHDHIGSGRPWDLDRRDGGVLILQPYLTRDRAGWYRGTADAVAQNWDTIEQARVSRVLVLSGDHVCKMDYRSLLLAHEQRSAAVTLAVTPVAPEESYRFGMVRMDRDYRIRQLEEKPAKSDLRNASMGIYVFETDVLREAMHSQPRDFVLDVLRPLISAGERVYAYEFTDYWEDVGTIEAFYRANRELLSPDSRLQMSDQRWPVLTRDEERPPVLLLPGADVECSLIANGCRIAGRVRNSVLFPGVNVLAGADIVDSVVMADVVVGRGASVANAILDKYTRVGEGAEVGTGEPVDRPELAWLAGLTLVGKDAVIPDGARVGRQVVLGVGASPSDFAAAELRPGARTPDRQPNEGLV